MFVVDASMALTWCIGDEATPATDAVLQRLLLEGGLAPALWPLEMANALSMAVRRGRMNEDELRRARSIIVDLPIDIRPVETSTAMGLVDPAIELDLTAYDAAYLGLAQARGLGLATLDKNLELACQREGVEIIRD